MHLIMGVMRQLIHNQPGFVLIYNGDLARKHHNEKRILVLQ